MKTKEELNALKEEVKTLNKKLAELTEEELVQVTGGSACLNYMDEDGVYIHNPGAKNCFGRYFKVKNTTISGTTIPGIAFGGIPICFDCACFDSSTQHCKNKDAYDIALIYRYDTEGKNLT